MDIRLLVGIGWFIMFVYGVVGFVAPDWLWRYQVWGMRNRGIVNAERTEKWYQFTTLTSLLLLAITVVMPLCVVGLALYPSFLSVYRQGHP